ncbi:MAG: hypothetical protein ABI538_02515 [Pseudoxanthomonas sp.]
MTTTPLSLDSVLKQMHGLSGQLQQLEAEKQQQLKDDLMRKQLLKALDDPQTRIALRSQLEMARNKIDALALQLDTQRQAVTNARDRVQKALDKLAKPASLSESLASKLAGITATASSSFRSVGMAAVVATPAPAAVATTARKTPSKSTTVRKPTR